LVDSEELLTIKGNALFLRLAFINLMENACKYNDEKTVDVLIETKSNGIEIKFEDNGYGIEEKDLEYIFEPYYRSTKVQQISGHGIGLPLTKRIVKIHHGEISIDSTINEGTKVKVFLPYSF
jgi:signal transduction histidine kinase